MQKINFLRRLAVRQGWLTAILILLFSFGCFQVSADPFNRSVNFSGKNVPLKTVFATIKHQTGYVFFYDASVIEAVKTVNVELKNSTVEDALKTIFKDQPVTWLIEGKTITILKKLPQSQSVQNNVNDPVQVEGTVTDDKGIPLPAVSIMIKGTSKGTQAGPDGKYKLNANRGDVLVFNFMGFRTKEITVGQSTIINAVLETSVSTLDQVQVIAYGTTTRRLSTGTISKVKGEEIRNQPVDNPLLALSGRMPGVEITQANGNSSAPVSVVIRGVNSLGASSEPLYIIDGIPFAHSAGSVTYASGISAQTLGGLTNASSGTSPFVNLNAGDIESIEVLKDADATAIYGSRGANGVVLITTRKAKAGKTTIDASFNTGWSRPTTMVDMMNTKQYVAMRKEAFRNDGIIPTTANATDLMVWDTTRYTDWTKFLYNKIARSTDGQVRVSGGSPQTQFSIASGFKHVTPIYYGDFSNDRISFQSNLSHRSNDNKFSVSVNASYNSDKNNLNTADLLQLVNTIPNAPYPIDSLGNLVWRDKGVLFSNPLAYAEKKYFGLTEGLRSSLNLGYKFTPNLEIKLDGGFNQTKVDQTSTNPTKSQSPFGTQLSTSDFFNQTQKNWTLEPQANYFKNWGKSKVQVLLGGSFQEQLSFNSRISASGYTSDELMLTPGPASSKTITSGYGKYRYEALFGRISYNWDDKYLINVSARRDGSSRFGSDNRFGNFGAVGAAWVFSEENFMKQLSFLSYGKLRGSVGVTGNDRIGNYQYLSKWQATNAAVAYQGVNGLYPVNLDNPDFAWERNQKWEAAMELGFLNDRIYLSADYYLNKTNNQLVGYSLPSQTGFTTLNANLNAVVQNSGWEFALNSTNIQLKDFTWKTAFNLTIPRNKLVKYPGIENSPYSSTYVVGMPIYISKWIKYNGVDPQTGIYQLAGTNTPKDQTEIYDLSQRYYGGLQNTLNYKSLSLDFSLQFVNKKGRTAISFSAPGTRINQPVAVLDRWQKPGDITDVQKFSTTGTPITTYSYYANFSEARVTDASFLRLKNVSLSYKFNSNITQKLHAQTIRLYVQGQNLFTVTPYKLGDPETMSYSTMPPLKTFTTGLQVIF
ncbi:SusC/RagA family TonB-linked outer membrane protein [Solitalea lacus]|uniref:SusC/RagA family TonB-linked outer membrane protein n=1 Tax=Solitalea lacus TaxID=2911172 RepID=UPI001EDBFEE9|nr:SusC/RagA family TonB-linked outer membrane protein [Solitalea lacus]UKJ06934.1 SusC/RagA family TonB-linked outer membrane protein [Solitalea lacus]